MIETSKFLEKIGKCADHYFPVFAAIEVTNRCNAHCEYCYIDDTRSVNELTTSQLHQVINKLNKENFVLANVTGGEPFLRDDITEILEHLLSSDFFSISIYSNGTVLNRTHFELLEKYRSLIWPFRMTVFSHYNKIHDAYMRIPGSLQTIVENGKELMRRGVKVQLAIPLLTVNIETIRDSIDYFLEQGFDVGVNLNKLITEHNQSDTMAAMITEDFYYTGINNLMGNSEKITIPKQPTDNLCRGSRENIVIDTNGTIHPCVAFRNLPIGSILSDLTVHEQMLKSSNYRELRELKKDDLPCIDCMHYDECTPCIALQHSLHNNFKSVCQSFCNLTKAYSKIYKEKKKHA